MKRRFDGSKVVYEWFPPAENALSQSVLIGSWAEGLDGVQPEVHQILEVALTTYLRRVLKNGVKNVKNEPRLPSAAEHASSLWFLSFFHCHCKLQETLYSNSKLQPFQNDFGLSDTTWVFVPSNYNQLYHQLLSARLSNKNWKCTKLYYIRTLLPGRP